MKELKELMDDIRCELKKAGEYAMEAVKHREEYPELSETYHKLATDGVIHAEVLEKRAKEMAHKHHVHELWEFASDMIMRELEDVKRHIEMYRMS